ncbi:MAG TPA: hypothetical protein VH061_09295 [Solirubrobacteraceae bacterium]|nr:hypothetical protein [Solirubrobacteraceae bacterium]
MVDPDESVNSSNMVAPTMPVDLGLDPAEAMAVFRLAEGAVAVQRDRIADGIREDGDERTLAVLEGITFRLKGAIMTARVGRIYRAEGSEPIPVSGMGTQGRIPNNEPWGFRNGNPFKRRKPAPFARASIAGTNLGPAIDPVNDPDGQASKTVDFEDAQDV